jgi:type I restriction-modification system DNA methylase subunit
MSEELLQTIPQQIGKYTYYRLGATTLNQLRDNGIIPKKNYAELSANKPDGLVVYHGAIKAVVEYKQPKDLSSPKDIEKAINQELAVARKLCKILIVTDSTKTFWINAKNGDRVKDEKGFELKTVFHPFLVKDTANLEYLLGEVDASLTPKNSIIRSAKLIDPTPLATRLWQTIWVATGKAPIKCLYNVVELFIFKFLSDLKVLPDDLSFGRIYQKAQEDPEDALDFYAKNTRTRILKLFPIGKDGTTIINGTIFVSESGDANLSQSILFQRSLRHLQGYTEEFGSLTKIDKQFKTKLYESFLLQEVEALGQYFTPRRLVQSIIRMSGVNMPSFQFKGKRICDPFCGVGGFPLEILNMNDSMQACYAPASDGKITVPFVLHGFDKGFERDDERTIILAKANMLIYLAELLFRSPQCSTEFAGVFNDTFTLFKDNLGTFGHIIKDEAHRYDLIFSNPPYVTSGSSIIKEEIRKTPATANEYPVNALGLESISLEWIIKSLKPGGQAFIILPDGILGRVGGKKLRDHVLNECYLEAIVSLPVRTFFSNWERTYILVITKKHKPEDIQSDPVFTYLVSNIGERLTSVKREEIQDDDLPEMENLFRIFCAAKSTIKLILEQQSGRCKVQPIEIFRDATHWVIDRWWTKAERLAVGADSASDHAGKQDVGSLLSEFDEALSEHDTFISESAINAYPTMPLAMGDKVRFKLFIGPRYLVKDVAKTEDAENKIPVYSSNVIEPMGYVGKTEITDFSHPTIIWGIDGNFEFSLIEPGVIFEITDHCGAIQILDSTIVPEYLLYALNARKTEEDFNRSFRPSLTNIRQFSVLMPVTGDGSFDAKAQKDIAEKFTGERERREKLSAIKRRLDNIFGRYLDHARLGVGD